MGWEIKVREKHNGTFASDEPEKALPFDEGLLKRRRFSFRLPIFNFLGGGGETKKSPPLEIRKNLPLDKEKIPCEKGDRFSLSKNLNL